MKTNLRKLIENPIFEPGILKWLGAINKSFQGVQSLVEIYHGDMFLSIVEITSTD
jgi:hypothetical protein